ncbi:ABC transporter ATP-binding protein [Salmonella enterica]|nr:ABC transporter ATP-binding protein [Salmonella enterica]
MNRIKRLLPEIQREIIGACVRRSKGLLAGFMLATFAASAATVAGPLIFAAAVDRISKGGASAGLLAGYFGLFAVSIAAARLLSDVKIVLMNRLEQEVRNQTNKDTLAALLRARGSIFAANNPSKISALVQNLHQSNTIYIQLFMMVLLAGVADIVLSFGAIAGYVSWYVAVFVIVYGVASVWLTLRSNDATTQYQRRARAKSNEGANLLGNVVANVVSIKVFRGQGWVSGLYDRYSRDAQAQWNQFYWVRLRYGAVQAGLVFVQYASIFAMLVLMLDSPNLLNQVVMVSMILIQLNRPFEMIASSLRDFVVAHGLAEPLQAELAQHSAPAGEGRGDPVPAGQRLGVRLAGLSFAYGEGAAPVLADVSADFMPGRLNFIVGPSGVGKSSLLQVLLRINDTYGGSVTVGGAELARIDVDDYLGVVGYVPQEPMLMNLGSLQNSEKIVR